MSVLLGDGQANQWCSSLGKGGQLPETADQPVQNLGVLLRLPGHYAAWAQALTLLLERGLMGFQEPATALPPLISSH